MWDKSGQSTDNGFNIVTSNWDDPPSMHVASNDHKKTTVTACNLLAIFLDSNFGPDLSL